MLDKYSEEIMTAYTENIGMVYIIPVVFIVIINVRCLSRSRKGQVSKGNMG